MRQQTPQADFFPSWNEGSSKASILRFVEAVTSEGGADFVPPLDRIAVVDNDGTLWSEKPTYFQLTFALDRVKALAGEHPEWREQQPFKVVLEDDLKGFLACGTRAVLSILGPTHGGNTTDEVEQIVLGWIASARRPRTGRLYTEMVFQPNTDAEREWAYDRESPVGRLDAALDEARARGWTVVDTQRDWQVVFPWENEG